MTKATGADIASPVQVGELANESDGPRAVAPIEPIYSSNLNLQEPLRPAAPDVAPAVPLPQSAAAFVGAMLDEGIPERDALSRYRRSTVTGSPSDLVFGSEGKFRATTDSASLLRKSLGAAGVRTQQRTPIVNDPRVRGSQPGRTAASGSYWVPARQDLDTALSKIDSGIIGNIVVVKGPYSALYGPGYDFIDYQLVPTPRYESGPEMHGTSFANYGTNGQQLYARQSFFGGSQNYGVRGSYGHRTGNDYETGGGFELPSSYNSRDANIAFGYDFSEDSHIEFNYLRLDQTNVEFPGLVYDINWLKTDGFDFKYLLENQPEFDLLTVDGWYNRTQFAGDTSRPGKNKQIPAIRENFSLAPNQFLVTDVDGMSAGQRTSVFWETAENETFILGTDLIRIGNQLNDIVPSHTVELFPGFNVTQPEQNFPIPRSESTDVGLFAERTRVVTEDVKVRFGGRVDLVNTNARQNVGGMGQLSGFPTPVLVEQPLSDVLHSDIEQNFTPWSLFLTSEFQLSEHYWLDAGVGHARRPPTLTELYAAGSFIGSLQPGLTFVYGDPQLQTEKNTQFDIGLRAKYDDLRLGASAFHSIINDYITYDYILPPDVYTPGDPFVPGKTFQGVAFTNTDLATLSGFELVGEKDIRENWSLFGVMDYVEGTDHTRNKASRLATLMRNSFFPPPNDNRSLVDKNSEPLPGIPPLQARLGARVYDQRVDPSWLVELEARMVDQQTRVASSLFEQPTAGFTVWNIRGLYRPRERLTIYAGVENFGDRLYREHLDYRSGRGVFQPGANFYSAFEWVY